MRMARLAVVLCGIALGLFVVSSVSASAQFTTDERDAKDRTWQHERGSIFVATPVVDAPFSGDVVTTWRPTSKHGTREVRATARYYRDRAGRVRVEQTFVGRAGGQPAHQVIVTPDLNVRWGYVLDPATRTAVRSSRTHPSTNAGGAVHFVLPVSMNCVIALFRPGLHVPLGEESLGQRMMDGVRVEGTRVRGMLRPELGRGETFDERWFSPELKLEMSARSEDGEIGVVEYRVTTISRAEPPAELFEVPANYVRAAPYEGIVALNPYAPGTWPRLPPSIKSLCGSGTPPGF